MPNYVLWLLEFIIYTTQLLPARLKGKRLDLENRGYCYHGFTIGGSLNDKEPFIQLQALMMSVLFGVELKALLSRLFFWFIV